MSLRRELHRRGLHPKRSLIAKVGSVRVGVQVLVGSRSPALAWHAWRMHRLSRKCFGGWATTHATRWWEYSWVMREAQRARNGHNTMTACDFGAGKSPVPVGLTRMGFRASVVDPDAEDQVGKVTHEWAWTDYGRWGIETHKAGMEDRIFAPASLGVALSVSVIEHMPADARRRGLSEIAAALEPGGTAILTVDVFPSSTVLANRVIEEVEPIEVHGTVGDLVNEAMSVGLEIDKAERSPLRAPRLDVVGLVFRRQGVKSEQ